MLLVACWRRWCWCVVFFFFAVPGYVGIGIMEMSLFGFGGWVLVQWVFYGIINKIFWNLCYKTIA
jgi:hypothetical protein